MDIAGLLEEKLAIPYLEEDEDDATTGPRLGKRKGQFQVTLDIFHHPNLTPHYRIK